MQTDNQRFSGWFRNARSQRFEIWFLYIKATILKNLIISQIPFYIPYIKNVILWLVLYDYKWINNTFELTTNDIYYLLQERLLTMDLALMMKDLGMDIDLVLLWDERMWDERRFNNIQ
jgi:hypothetical protein